MIGKPHVLSVTDVQRGIQALAASLGTDVATLVETNNLSPPYITLNASEKYGPALSSFTLSGTLAAGAASLAISNQPQSTNTLYLSYSGQYGLVAESVSVRSYDGKTFTLATPLQNSYPSGTLVQMFSSYVVGNVNVLLPGNIIYVPVTDSGNFNINSQSQLVDAFGTDFAWPLSFDSNTGDLATVTGEACGQQRFATVLQTDLNSLPLHTDFGSKLRSRLGSGSPETPWPAYVREALMKLPEVIDVQNIQAVQAGTSLPVTAEVYVSGSDKAITVNTTVNPA